MCLEPEVAYATDLDTDVFHLYMILVASAGSTVFTG